MEEARRGPEQTLADLDSTARSTVPVPLAVLLVLNAQQTQSYLMDFELHITSPWNAFHQIFHLMYKRWENEFWLCWQDSVCSCTIRVIANVQPIFNEWI